MSGTVTGAPRVLLRLENLLIGLSAMVAYSHFHGRWILFAALFLLPDLSMLGYLGGPKMGAAFYNSLHWYALPFCCIALGAAAGIAILITAGLVWVAHIALDRAIGYGLKYTDGFGKTHLSAPKPENSEAD